MIGGACQRRPGQDGELAGLRGSKVFRSTCLVPLAAPDAPLRGGFAFGGVASFCAGTGLTAGAAPVACGAALAASLLFSSGVKAW